MHSISRRGFVISAATAGAAFGLDGPLEFIGSAFAQSNPALLEKGFVKFKVGDVEVTQIYDGIWNRELQDGFVKNAALADVQAALKAAGLAENIVPIPFTVTAVTIGGKTTLIDSGTGVPGQVQPSAGLAAAKNLAAAGIDAGKVENIVDIALPSGSHLRADGQGHQRRAVSESHDPRVRAGTRMVDGSVRAAGRARLGQPHQGHAGHLEERQGVRGRQGSRAWHPRRSPRRATRRGTRAITWARAASS